MLKGWAASRGVSFLDLSPALRNAAASKQLVYPLDQHFTKAGHQVAAEAIAEWISKQKLLPLPEAKGRVQ